MTGISGQDTRQEGWVDTHVHIFRRDGALAPDHRYAPAYDALPESLLERMAQARIASAVLVQPSFLGLDNSFLLAAIAARPAAFSGIAVVDPGIGLAELAALAGRGILGVRLNCIGRPAPDFSGDHGVLARHLASLGMVLQIQAEGAQWRGMEAFLSASPCPVLIDHFGRTAPGDSSGGFEVLLRAARCNDRLWFKFSAPYRLPRDAASACAGAILDTIGSDRIVWGSDWPHTQFEGGQAYAETLMWLADWMPSPQERAKVLGANPLRLFGLSGAKAASPA